MLLDKGQPESKNEQKSQDKVAECLACGWEESMETWVDEIVFRRPFR